MKKLLIHNNNTFLNQTDYFSIEEQFVFGFNTDNVEIDKIIHNELTTGTLIGKIMQSDVLFIKISLSKNYLEYLGIRLAYHIRLTKEIDDKSTIPIVFVAEEDIQFVGITSEIPSILFTRGIYFMKDNLTGFNDYKALIEQNKLRDSVDLNFFKASVVLPAPTNYSSHHSIDNELALLTWAEYIRCFNELPFEKLEFHNSLFYKLYKGDKELAGNKKTLFKTINDGKILLIDDEFDKGWHIFYNTLFEQNEGIVFDSVQLNFKQTEKEQIIEESFSMIEKFNPDLVLLDLRLTEDDFTENKNPKELTGYKILQLIKNYNKGIRVIVVTASNKAWNFKALQDIGASDYITKSIDEDANDKLNYLLKSVNRNLELSSFLKNCFTKIKTIKDILKTQSYHQKNKFKDFYKSSIRNLDISFELLENTLEEKKFFNYAFLQLFLIIENYLNNDFIFQEGKKCYVLNNNKHIRVLEFIKEDKQGYKHFNSSISYNNSNYRFNITTGIVKFRRIEIAYKMSAILIYRFGFQHSNALKWNRILSTRNEIAHGGGNSVISQDKIITLLKFLCYIIDERKSNEKNLDKSLDMSENSKLELLSEKFNHNKKR